MDFEDKKFFELFMEIQYGLPRGGPGNTECTLKALEFIPALPNNAKILDIGCGPGMQTMDLAKALKTEITALDYYENYLTILSKKIKEQGLEDFIKPQHGSMFDLKFPDEHFDLIWSEGAIFIIGFKKGLCEWKRKIKKGGYLVISEAVWLKPDPPKEVWDYWKEGYPALSDIPSCLETIKQCGYSVQGHFTLPRHTWIDHYYAPMQQGIDEARKKYTSDQKTQEVYDDMQIEIDIFDKYSDYFGYEFFVCKT